jgi:hypothetical protein
MLIGIFVTLLITGALAYALHSGPDALIGRRPYSNRYNDAAGAREDI